MGGFQSQLGGPGTQLGGPGSQLEGSFVPAGKAEREEEKGTRIVHEAPPQLFARKKKKTPIFIGGHKESFGKQVDLKITYEQGPKNPPGRIHGISRF